MLVADRYNSCRDVWPTHIDFVEFPLPCDLGEGVSGLRGPSTWPTRSGEESSSAEASCTSRRSPGHRPAEIGIVSSAAALPGFAASLLFGVLSDKVGAKRVLILLFLAQARGFSPYPVIDGAAACYILIVAVGL